MIAKANGRYIRVSPRKVRQVIDLIRGKDVGSALGVLMNVKKSCSELVSKVLKSAISNAKQKGLSENQIYISKITADEGPSWQRFRAAAFGRATPVLKRTTHLKIELDLLTK
ncbi:MAG: 50S ribosomal protein L22 [Candidatus Omnitrophica bacterium]|nr:50S ribosomal protein L22 [Candidatus Omnitrophota bacterium]